MSLKTRIQLSTTVLLIGLLLIANTSIYFNFKSTSIESEQSRLVHTATNIIEELHKYKDSTMEQVLHSFQISDGIINIIDHNNEPLHQITANKMTYRAIKSEFSSDQYEDVLTFKDSKFIVVSIPIINENGDIINLQIIENVDLLFSNITDLKGVLIFTSVVVITMLFMAGWILGGVISRPIQRLIRTMKTIEEKESYEQITITRNKKDELNQLATTFNLMIAKLEDSYMKQEQFVSDASHELKTPLTVIAGYIKLLKRWGTKRPEVMMEAVNSIESESNRMKYLTEQLLQLAAAEEISFDKKEPINIMQIVDHTIKRIRPMYKNNINFLNSSSDLYVNMDEQSFVQVLVILLDNANKYSNDLIKVELMEEKDLIKVKISDRGKGIPKKEQAYIFDRMYRVDKTRNRKTGGTGLGLPIAKRIVEKYGGSITLESVEEVGSTFIIVLPKKEV